MKVIIQSRAFGSELTELPVSYNVQRFSHAAIGGPKSATIGMSGPDMDLWTILDRLRCPVKIYSDFGDCVWWGYVESVQMQAGALTVDITIDSMHNEVQVVYQDSTTKTKTDTGFGGNASSVAEYGHKQLVYSGANTSAAAAAAIQAIILDQQKYPIPGITQAQGANGPVAATLTCKGWWDTLEWQYAYYPSVMGPAYSTTSAAEQVLGNVASTQKVMQQITTAGAIKANSLQVYARKENSPIDGLVFGIFALDVSGNPTGSVLASGTILAANIGASLAWNSVNVSEVTLSASTQYGLVVYRSGAIDISNFYVVGVNAALGYAGGAFKIYNGTNWVARSPDADMNFQILINNQVEITSQISNLITNYGQFMVATDISAASSISVSSYRDGSTTTLVEVRALMEMGGINGRRYLAQVDQNRRLLIWEESAVNMATYTIDQAGLMTDNYNSPIRKEQCAVGVYLRLKDVIPGSVNMTRISDPSLMFVEEAEYTPAQDSLRITPRGVPTISDLGKVRNA